MVGSEEWGGVTGEGEENLVEHGGLDLSAVRRNLGEVNVVGLR